MTERDVLAVAEQCLGRVRAFSTPHSTHQWGDCECTGIWEGKQPGQLTLTDKKVIPHHMESCSVMKFRGRRSSQWHLSSQVIMGWYSVFGEAWTPACRWEIVNEFLIFTCFKVQILLYIKLPISESMSFLTFCLLILIVLEHSERVPALVPA